MKPLSRINSPSIDIEDFFDGLSWESTTDIQENIAALESGIRLLHEELENNLVVPTAIDFRMLTRTLQDSDPMFQVCGILEEFITTHSGEAPRFKKVAADLALLRGVLAGLLKYASDDAGKEVRENTFRVYLELLPKIHDQFVFAEDALLRWKASVLLNQQIEFVGRALGENEGIAETEALLAWGNDYMRVIMAGEAEGNEKIPLASEVAPLLADLKTHYLELLRSETKREVEEYEETIVLTPAIHEHALSGFSELIFRARKEAEKGATFRLTLDFEAVPVAAPAGEGPTVPVQPVHLKRAFKTSYVQLEEVRKLIDGFVTSLREEVESGVFKEQDSQSLRGWFTESVVPWVETDEVVLEKD